MLDAHKETFINLFFSSQNLTPQICRASNNNHAHKILAPNSIEIVGYQAFNYDEFVPLISFLSPQIMLVNSFHASQTFLKHRIYVRLPSALSSLFPSLHSLLSLAMMRSADVRKGVERSMRGTRKVEAKEAEEWRDAQWR